jgi:excisionase family DNA binding protein
LSQTNSSYQIYALIDPRDNAVRYVGLSTDAYVRFYGHLNSTNDYVQKKRWIIELRRQGLSPILQVIETVDASVDAQSIAHEREYHWIQEMLRLGHPLLNVRGNKHAYVRVSVPDYQKKRKPIFKIRSTKGWLSVEDIAKELGVHVDTVRGWIRDRKLRATKLGRDYRIRRVDLDKFLEERTTNPDEPERD